MVNALGGRLAVVRTVSRFVTGTGWPHPVENGFAWHHVLGVPYLPASSLKGAARSWAKSVGDPTDDFGSASNVGNVVFLDVLPTQRPPLVVEVLTPHYGGWTVDDPPGDWRDPTPIPFLVVKENAEFLVAILPNGPMVAPNAVDRVWSHVVQALTHTGVGAKTTLGFGRFYVEVQRTAASTVVNRTEVVADTPVTPKIDTPVEHWYSMLVNLNGNEVYERALEAVNNDELPQEKVAGLVEALERLGYLSAWREGRKQNGENSGSKKLRDLARRLAQRITSTAG